MTTLIPAREPLARAVPRPAALLLAAFLLLLAAMPPGARAASGESSARSVQQGALAAGAYTSCALRGSGRIGCWGAGDHGQLGNGSSVGDNAGALAVSGIDDATQIAFGAIHGCAIRSDRTVWCWGADDRGQLGDGKSGAAGVDATTPQQVPGITDATAITTMNSGTCVLRATGTVTCWGDNDGGEVGAAIDNSGLPASAYVATPHDVPGLSDVVAIDAGWWHVCAVKRDGTLWCWGFNGDGQVGQTMDASSFASQRFPTPVQVPGVSNVVAVSGGVYQTCFLRKDGTIGCMGSDAVGEAGLGTPRATSSGTPADVVGLSGKAVSLTVGMQVGCALIDDGSVQCWGDDSVGELGNDAALQASATPVTVHDLTASAISADRHTVCALSRSRSVSCWGEDTWSNLGNGGDVSNNVPGVQGVLELTSPYGVVAAPVPSVEVAATATDGDQLTATVRVRNDGPDATAPVVQLSTDRRLELGTTLPADVDGSGDHGATWRPGTIAAGATATIQLPLTAVGAGSASVRALVSGSDALDPRRPFGRGAFVDAQRASSAVTIAPAPAAPVPSAPSQQSAITKTPSTPGPTPAPTPAPLDAAAVIALARPTACHRAGAPLRIVIAPPSGATVRTVTVGRKGRKAIVLKGTLTGRVKLPAAVVRTLEGPGGSSRAVTVHVELADGRAVDRSLAVKSCR